MKKQPRLSSWHAASAGFTLIELLIVIAIITILASLLMPALRNTHEQALQIQCLNNTRIIGIGMHTYTNSAYGYLPLRDTMLSETYRFWYRKIYREITDREWVGDPTTDGSSLFFRCPKFSLPISLGWTFNTIPYGKNEYLGSTTAASAIKTTRIKRPSKVIMVSDSDDDGRFGLIVMSHIYALGNRHGNKFSAVMVDGHSSLLEVDKYLAPGVSYGYMDENGTTIVSTTGSTTPTAWHSDFLKYSWGYYYSTYDFLTK